MVADGAGDEARGNRRAVIVQDRHQPDRIDAVLVDDQLAQLGVAVLLDHVNEVVIGDEACDAGVEREGAVYVDNMQRLVRKFETAQDMVPRPLQANAAKPTKYGVIYFGSTSPAMDEAIGLLEARGHHLDRLRIRAFPFHSSVASFIADHDFVYVVEQNRDGQLRSLIVNENGIDPVRLVPILHYDGTPITARFIANAIGDHLDALKVTPLRKVVS